MCCNQQKRSANAEDQFQRTVEAFATPRDYKDETHPGRNERKQRFAAMHQVTRNEARKSEQDDAHGQQTMKGSISWKIGDDIREETDDDWCEQAMDHANGGGGGSCNVCMAMKTADGC